MGTIETPEEESLLGRGFLVWSSFLLPSLTAYEAKSLFSRRISMSASLRKILYFMLAIIMMIDFYLIFNAGSPNSLLRLLIKSTDYDISITVGLSIIIVLISFSMIRDNDQNSIIKILERNSGHIAEQKKMNLSDDEIADSFMKELGSKKGALHAIVRWRVVRYLSKM
jgi:hypothetical protein